MFTILLNFNSTFPAWQHVGTLRFRVYWFLRQPRPQGALQYQSEAVLNTTEMVWSIRVPAKMDKVQEVGYLLIR